MPRGERPCFVRETDAIRSKPETSHFTNSYLGVAQRRNRNATKYEKPSTVKMRKLPAEIRLTRFDFISRGRPVRVTRDRIDERNIIQIPLGIR